MRKEILVTGKDVELALANAREALGVDSTEDISFEIVDLGSRGIFGIGARPTKVKAWIELPDTVAPLQHGPATPAPRKPRNEEGARASEGGEHRQKNRRRGRGGNR